MAKAELEAEIARAVEIVSDAHYPVALVGAGMSVESGIPPFRGPGGLWTRYGEPDMRGYQRFLEDPRKWWLDQLKAEGPIAEFRETFRKARPNPGHLALAEMEAMGYMKCIITQNVDNLHQEAGSQHVAEIHGNSTKLRCIGCSARWSRTEFEIEEYPPLCPNCGGIVKDDTVMFGEPIPFDVMALCEAETSRCDCMLLIGTTAEVYPAAGFPTTVRANGGALIEVNPYETVISHQCDVTLRAPSGQVLPKIMDGIKSAKSGGGKGS
ncbi:MAG: NAD-dependent deacetylase [Dehalococcoidia bacterium]